MGKYITSQYKSEAGETWTVELWDSNYSGTVIQYHKIEGSGVVFDINGNSTDRNEPLLTTTATVTYITDSIADEAKLDNFVDAEEGRFVMKVYRDATLEFIGRMIVDIAVRGDTNYKNNVFRISATDGLSILKGVEYLPTNPYSVSFLRHVVDILANIGTASFFLAQMTI